MTTLHINTRLMSFFQIVEDLLACGSINMLYFGSIFCFSSSMLKFHGRLYSLKNSKKIKFW